MADGDDRPWDDAPPAGLLKRFGSRNHPATKERKRRMQKAREGMAVTEETVAAYTAARAFILGEWFGASLMVASFTLLFLLGPHCPTKDKCAPSEVVGAPVGVTLGVCLILLLGGAFIFWKNHAYYVRLGFLWAKRWDNGAIVMAGAGAVFWLLFAVLEVLTLLRVRVLPG